VVRKALERWWNVSLRSVRPIRRTNAMHTHSGITANAAFAPLRRAVATLIQTVACMAGRAVEASKARQGFRGTAEALAGLDARTLRDLGLDRAEIFSVAAEAAGNAELTRLRILTRLGM
jgi:uncharacterized protein YjiS (DUF1127 family)